MYCPKQFSQNDPEKLKALIRDYPLATLITHSDSGLEANQIPFILNQANNKQVLQGHLAKANPLWKTINNYSEVLVVFHGPDCYISPNYYPSKQQDGKAVPTWNYVSVQVKGVMSYIEDKDWNRQMINKLTDQHEAGQPSPWTVDDAPSAFTDKMLKAIVGIEIEVLSMMGKWKVSQNQSRQNQQGVIAALSQRCDSHSQAMATIVNGAID